MYVIHDVAWAESASVTLSRLGQHQTNYNHTVRNRRTKRWLLSFWQKFNCLKLSGNDQCGSHDSIDESRDTIAWNEPSTCMRDVKLFSHSKKQQIMKKWLPKVQTSDIILVCKLTWILGKVNIYGQTFRHLCILTLTARGSTLVVRIWRL